MGTTSDPSDPRLTRGVNDEPVSMAEVYLVLSDEERAKGFVRPVRRTYVHWYWLDGRMDPLPVGLTSLGGGLRAVPRDLGIGGCGAATTMGQAIAETYARDPGFYGATFCVGCGMHREVGEHGEFIWDDGSGQKVGT